MSLSTPRRPLPTVLRLVAALSILVAACGGSASPSPSAATAAPTAAATPTAAPTEAPTPTEQAQQTTAVGEAAGKLADLTSYRFAVTLTAKGLAAGSAFKDGSVKMSGTIILKPTKALQFGLDSSGQGQTGKLSFIVIGDQAWFDFGGGYQEAPAGQAGSLDETFKAFEPETLFGQTYSNYADQLKEVGSETKNGVESTHYTADESVLGALSAVYGVTGSWSMDLWLAKDGGYLVSAAIKGAGQSGTEAGEFNLTMDITNIDDPANAVNPPK